MCHYRSLQFCICHGLVLKKINRVIAFKQEYWLEPLIKYCTEQRQVACTDYRVRVWSRQTTSQRHVWQNDGAGDKPYTPASRRFVQSRESPVISTSRDHKRRSNNGICRQASRDVEQTNSGQFRHFINFQINHVWTLLQLPKTDIREQLQTAFLRTRTLSAATYRRTTYTRIWVNTYIKRRSKRMSTILTQVISTKTTASTLTKITGYWANSKAKPARFHH